MKSEGGWGDTGATVEKLRLKRGRRATWAWVKKCNRKGAARAWCRMAIWKLRGLRRSKECRLRSFDVPRNAGEKRNFRIVNFSLLIEKIVRHAENCELRNLGKFSVK